MAAGSFKPNDGYEYVGYEYVHATHIDFRFPGIINGVEKINMSVDPISAVGVDGLVGLMCAVKRNIYIYIFVIHIASWRGSLCGRLGIAYIYIYIYIYICIYIYNLFPKQA